MIFIQRDRCDAKGNKIQPSSDWFEKARAATQRAKADGPTHEIDEGVYRHQEVKRALEKLFHQKCAYCETPIEGFEVEHFRPKGKVFEDNTHPGYYWLAYEWSNLYPGCPFCNQKRVDHPTWDEPKTGPSAGKATQFPLASGSRARGPDDKLADEQPLLLDPCVDDPEPHFSINPYTGDLLCLTRRGEGSRKIFNLNRKRLRDQRLRHLGPLRRLLTERAANPARDWSVELNDYTAEDRPFAGACRALVRDPRI